MARLTDSPPRTERRPNQSVGSTGPQRTEGRRTHNHLKPAGLVVFVLIILMATGCTDNAGSAAPTNTSTNPAGEQTPVVSAARPGTSVSTGQLSGGDDARAGYVTAADAACDTARHQLGDIAPANGPTELVATLKGQLLVQQDLLIALGQLTPPDGDRAAITARFIDPYRQAIASQQALLPAVERAVQSNDSVDMASLHTDYDTAAHHQSVAGFVRDYGFHACQRFDFFRSH